MQLKTVFSLFSSLFPKQIEFRKDVKSGLPDMRIVVNGLALEVELKDTNGTPSELQKHNIRQINRSTGLGFVLYPEGFPKFQKIVKVVKTCPPNVPIVTAFTLRKH